MSKIDTLLQKAQDCLDTFPPEVDLAKKFYSKALKLDPACNKVLDAFGEFMCNMGEVELAIEMLMKSCKSKPEENSSKYMYLAQMMTGREALECIERGIAILKKDSEKEAKSRLASAYCMVVEVYMTDLCDEPEAQQTCDQALTEALRTDPQHFEANSCMATFKKVIGEIEEARKHASVCVGVLDEIGEDEDRLPDYEIRVNLSQTLMDLHLLEEALRVLELLIQENADIRVWFLFSHAQLLSKNLEEAMECLEYAEAEAKSPELKEHWMPQLITLRQQIETKLKDEEQDS